MEGVVVSLVLPLAQKILSFFLLEAERVPAEASNRHKKLSNPGRRSGLPSKWARMHICIEPVFLFSKYFLNFYSL
jgi:hypothetical protein